MTRFAPALAIVSLCLLSRLATPAAAQHPETRHGLWGNLGLGYGSLGCGDCGGRTGTLSGDFMVGGTPSQKILLGVGSSVWVKSESGATLTVGIFDLRMRYYPSTHDGLFLTTGIGFGTVRASASGFESQTETGFGGLAGTGYDFRIARSLSLTPFVNWFLVTTSGSNANVFQIGLGVTAH